MSSQCNHNTNQNSDTLCLFPSDSPPDWLDGDDDDDASNDDGNEDEYGDGLG